MTTYVNKGVRAHAKIALIPMACCRDSVADSPGEFTRRTSSRSRSPALDAPSTSATGGAIDETHTQVKRERERDGAH